MKRLFALASLALAGCSFSSGNQIEPKHQTNTCASDADCGAGARCVPLTLADGEPTTACASTTVQLPDLLLEVIPPTSAQGAKASYLVPISELGTVLQGSSDAGIVTTLDIDLPSLVPVPGVVFLDPTYDGAYACRGSDGSYPVDVELRRNPPAAAADLSLGSQLVKSYEASSELVVDDLGASSWRFDLAVPPGDYDLYVVPRSCDGDVPPPPPAFFPGQVIDAAVGFDVTLPAASRLSGVVMPPPAMDLRGYFIEVLEPKSGRALSPPTQLGPGLAFDLPFAWATKAYVPIVRVRPPGGGGDPSCAASCGAGEVCSALDGACLPAGACNVDEDCSASHACVEGACVPGARPTVHYSLEALALQGSTENIVLDMSDLAFDVRKVSGQAVDDAGQPVVGAVELRSTQLEGSAPNATVAFTVDTDASGVFEAWIPPGSYRLVARPSFDDEKALSQRQLDVPSGTGCFCGQSVVVPDRARLVGHCSAWLGDTPAAAQVVASPAIEEGAYFSDALTLAPVAPREVQGLMSDPGDLTLAVDPGSFDLSIRPDPETLLPWLVQPRLTVLASDAGTQKDLGELVLPAPVFLKGTLHDASGTPVEGATLRAWLPVTDDEGKRRAVLIGEVVTTGATYLFALPRQ